MHQTRQKSTTKLPIPRKGTKYVVRASSHITASVPVLIAVRDMLKLAKTAKEVKGIIRSGAIKINGKAVKDHHESIRLFNILEANKSYQLSILPTGRFFLEETKTKEARICKVINKRLIKNNVIQLNLHDGSNIRTKENVKVGDSLCLDFSGKIKKHIPLEKGAQCFVFSGRHQGQKGVVEKVENKVAINFKEGSAQIDASRIIVI